MGPFKAWLSVWIGAAMLAGLFLGILVPETFKLLAGLSVAHVNPITAILVWILILPSMVQVNYSGLTSVWRSRNWMTGSVITTLVNWLIKPFTLAILATLFLGHVFANFIPPGDVEQYTAGLILLGVAPCTGMVFVWSRLTSGDAGFTLSQVSLNNVILLFAFAPIAGFLLGITGISIPWSTLIMSTTIYVIVPLIAGYFIRGLLLNKSDDALNAFDEFFSPVTKTGLLLLVLLLFGFQADAIIARPLIVILISIPLIIQALGIFLLAYGISYIRRLPASIAAPAALIGTSNFFELAVAVAVSLFGVASPAAVATVVGVLVEVPMMLLLVAVVNRTSHILDSRAIT